MNLTIKHKDINVAYAKISSIDYENVKEPSLSDYILINFETFASTEIFKKLKSTDSIIFTIFNDTKQLATGRANLENSTKLLARPSNRHELTNLIKL